MHGLYLVGLLAASANSQTVGIGVPNGAGTPAIAGYNIGASSIPVNVQNTVQVNVVSTQAVHDIMNSTISASQFGTWTPSITTFSYANPGYLAYGSTLAVHDVINSTITVNPHSITNATFTVTGSTLGITVADATGLGRAVGFQTGGSSVPVQIMNAPTFTVANTTLTVTGSTINVMNVAGFNLNVALAYSTFNVANTTLTVTGSTVSVMNVGGTALSVSIASFSFANPGYIAYSSTFAVHDVMNSTITVNPLAITNATFTVTGSTLAITVADATGLGRVVGFQTSGSSMPVQVLNIVQTQSGNKVTFSTTTATLVSATAVSSNVILALWHPPGVTKRYTMARLDISSRGGAGGANKIEIRKIYTAAPTGGQQCIGASSKCNGISMDEDDGASGSTVMTLPTTVSTVFLSSGSYWTTDLPPGTSVQALIGDAILGLHRSGKYPVLRASKGEGWAIVQVVETALTTAQRYIVSLWWTEE